MTIKELKKYIFENDKIEFVLEGIGCHHIKYNPNKEFYSCANHDGDNISAVNVYNNEHLMVRNWTRMNEFDECSDIITLTQYNKGYSFMDAVKFLYNLLGLEYKPKKVVKKEEKKHDPLYIFKKVLRSRKKVDPYDIRMISEKELEEFVPILHIDWLRDGIMPWTAEKFGLCYSYKRKRVIIPMRYWLDGSLLGLNARTTIENYNELGIKKYMITPSYQKSLNLFGLYENYESIKKAGYVVVYESERSVLKRDSLGDGTGVALSGHTLSDEQARILIGLNVEIVIALDKDIPIEEIRAMCEKLYRIRNVSYIYDKNDVLFDKQSPADAKTKIYNYLFKFRNTYDEAEHQKYLESLEK